MKLKLSETCVDCIPMSFAMCMDVHIDKIYRLIGHNGKKVIDPSEKEPFCYSGFHIHELIAAAWQLGFKVTEFNLQNYLKSEKGDIILAVPIQKAKDHMYNAMNKANGVLMGRMSYTRAPHAVAWDFQERQIFDPAGLVYDVEAHKIQIEVFYAITR